MNRIDKNRYRTERWISESVLAKDKVKAIATTEGICLVEIDKSIDHRCVKCQDKFVYTEKNIGDRESIGVTIRATATCKLSVCKYSIAPSEITLSSWGDVSPPSAKSYAAIFGKTIDALIDSEIKKEEEKKPVNKNFGTW